MTNAESSEGRLLKEWAPLNRLLREIPMTVRRGLFLETVSLTCVDAVTEYIAVGTNIGVVYWYQRETHNMQRLRPEKNNYKITCVKVVSSVDFMVAAGDESGTVSIFRIPKPTPDWISIVYRKSANRNNVERYTVGGIHSAPVTALEWSTNSQKLFSGDATGLVVCTEMDFYMNLSKACEILNEKYRIVQLSFHQSEQALVVATEYRCIVAHRCDTEWRVIQVGQKERKSLCRVGATIFPHPTHPLKRLIYSGRPGFRYWLADSEGVVQKTIIFKDAVRKPHTTVRLLQPPPPPVKDTGWEEELGPVLVWQGEWLVSYNSTALVMLDPDNVTVVASLTGLSELHSVCVTPAEIFLVYGTRNIVRLAFEPDPLAGDGKDPGLSLLDLNVSPVAETLSDLTSKLKSTAAQLVNSRPTMSVIGSVEEEVVTGTDALEFELPPVVPLEGQVSDLAIQLDSRLEMLEEIGRQSFDDILHSTTKKRKLKSDRMESSTSTIGSGLDTSRESVSDASTRPPSSNVAGLDTSRESVSDASTRPPSRNNNQPPPQSQLVSLDLVISSSHSQAVIPPDILPDLRSPDSIRKDVHDKEILVAKAFNLEEVLLSHLSKPSRDNAGVEKTAVGSEEREQCIGYGPPSGSSSAIPSLDPTNPTAVQDIITTLRGAEDHPLAEKVTDTSQTVECATEYNDDWWRVACPENAQYLSVSGDYVCMSGSSRTLHSSPTHPPVPQWRKLGYRAGQLILSPNSKIVWKVDFGVASALKASDSRGPEGGEWELAAREVESVALTDTCAWYVSAGKLYLQTELSRSKPCRDGCRVPCPSLVIKVCCAHNMVWVLTADYWVLWRAGLSDDCLEGSHWLRVNTPLHLQVADMALGPYNVGWLVDRSNTIYFSDNYITDNSSWWQVLIRNYMFENGTLCQISSNENSVWITNKVSPFVYKNSSTIKGHHWADVTISNITPPVRWKHITAGGVFDEGKGLLWLLNSINELFFLQPNCDNINTISLPCKGEEVSSVSAAPHALWLLTVTGHIYVRQGMCDECSEGNNWRLLNLEQISDKHVTLCHVSCGCDIIWACDTKGDTYMAAGSPYLIATDTFSPAWVQVDGKPLPDTFFVKVYVGSQSHIVWALDNKHNVYVRSGIFHDFLLGTEWLLVPGVQASQIAISGSLVWVLTVTGSVFCRFGISENNYIGNYWYQVPGSLIHLTASWFTNYQRPLSEGLWGVTDKGGCLVAYTQYSLGVSESLRQTKVDASREDDDWEVI